MASGARAVDEAALEAWRERLDDLRHDLGRHARLPLALLPRDAPPDAVREALAAGLMRTRRGPSGTVTARAMWTTFAAGAAPALGDRPAWADLEAAAAAVLGWEAALAPGAPAIDRAAAEADLARLAGAIEALREGLG